MYELSPTRARRWPRSAMSGRIHASSFIVQLITLILSSLITSPNSQPTNDRSITSKISSRPIRAPFRFSLRSAKGLSWPPASDVSASSTSAAWDASWLSSALSVSALIVLVSDSFDALSFWTAEAFTPPQFAIICASSEGYDMSASAGDKAIGGNHAGT